MIRTDATMIQGVMRHDDHAGAIALSTKEALRAEGLWKFYGSFQAVTDVSIHVDSGTITGLLGPNGAGKSTLFGMLAGDLRPSRGRVWIDGTDVTTELAWRRARRQVNRTFQVPRVFETMTVAQNLALGLRHTNAKADGRMWGDFDRTVESAMRQDGARWAVRLCGLEGSLDLPVRTFTMSERRRVELASVLCRTPRLILLDEPTAGLGVEEAEAFVDVLRQARSELDGLTILFASHDVDLFFRLADRAILLGDGRKLLDDEAEVVRTHPLTKEVYLG